MNAVKNLVKVHSLSRNFSTSHVRCRDLTRLKELQRQFQVDDGVPVYLKRGASDRVLFGVVCIGVAISLGWSAHTVKRLIYPSNK